MNRFHAAIDLCKAKMLQLSSLESGVIVVQDQMEVIIEEVEHSLTAESMVMTEVEKENLRKVGRGELTYDDLLAIYIANANRLAAIQAKA